MLIFITNRKLCQDHFIQRISLLVQGKPDAIMLREKDLSLPEYEDLALKIKEICYGHQVPLIINQNMVVAAKLKLTKIHLSMPDLRRYRNEIGEFMDIGASVHSVAEAKEAEKLGATYLIAGHIFSTDCKKGVPPRGLSFLEEVCAEVAIPVFAIGGITGDRVKDVLRTGAKGICVMSEAMICSNPLDLADKLRT